MFLKKEENKLKNNVLRIIKNHNLKTAISLVADLKYENKKLGAKKAKQLCNLYIDQSVDFKNKPNKFNYVKEVESNLRTIN